MDGTDDLTNADTTRTGGGARPDIRARLQAVMQPPLEAPVDVSAYLLHPPPSAAELERRGRRRRQVQWGSLIAAAGLALVLLVPMPGGGSAAGGDPGAPSADVVPASDETYPQRVDVPVAVAPSRATTRAPAARVRAAKQHPPSTTARRVVVRATTRQAATTPRPIATIRAPATAHEQVATGAPSVSSSGAATAATPPTPPAVGGGSTTSTDAPATDEGVGTSRRITPSG